MKRAYINVHLITVDQENHIYPNGGILYENGIITAVGESKEIAELAKCAGAEIKDGTGKYLFPGLVNTHTHLYQELTKGKGADLSLEEWFPKAMAPIGVVLRERHMKAGVALGLLEAVRSGVTTVADYMQHQPVPGLGIAELEVAKEFGVRMVYGRGYRDIGRKEVVESSEKIFADVDDLKQRYETEDGMVKVWLAPAAGWGVTPELLAETRVYADKTGTPIMMHMFETEEDNNGSLRRNQKPAICYYEDAGLLGEDLLAVHSVAVHGTELQKYKEYGVKVSYNPVSNMYLSSGVAPICEMQSLGLTVGLGTDGAGSNNNNDMLEAMKTGALLQKTFYKDPQSLTAEKTLRMATIEGAKALHMDHMVGSLEVGKKADFFLFDPMKSVKACPVRDIVATLVYSGDYCGVDTVVINGKTILEDGSFCAIDEKAVLCEAQKMSDDLEHMIGEL